MGDIYDNMLAFAVQQKEKGLSKETQKQGMMVFWDAILEEVYKTKGETAPQNKENSIWTQTKIPRKQYDSWVRAIRKRRNDNE